MRLGYFVFIVGLFYFMVTGNVYGSGFNLKSIGEVETGGQQISHWWYTGTKPVFHGEATPNTEVVVDIDGTALQINADSSGNWDFAPTSELDAGDHQVSLKSGGSEINFTLTTGSGNVNWDAVGSGSASTLPTVGTVFPTIFLLIGGLGILTMGGKIGINATKS